MLPFARAASVFALLLAAQLNEAQATRVQAAKSSTRTAQHLRVKPADDASPLEPAGVAAAVADLFGSDAGANNSSPLAFQTVCADLMHSKVDGLDKTFTDANVEAAVSDACAKRRLFAAVNGTAHGKNCALFAAELAGARRAHIANASNSSYSQFCQEYQPKSLGPDDTHPVEEDPEVSAAVEEEKASNFLVQFMVQFIFGVVYYFTVVSKYPMITGDKDVPENVKNLQAKNEVSSLTEVTPSIAFLSLCCPAARMSHNLHSTGTLNFWAGLLLMTCCPGIMCCTLFLANSCTPMNEKLGGERRGIVMGLLCAWCCSCCVIAQDAESMDLLVGVRTGVCSVAKA